MRKFFLIIAVVCSAAAISCTKQGTGRFEGGWSYKMSGTVTVEVVTTSIVSGEITTETQTLSITNETGQMHIAPTGNGDEMVVTMSAIGAGVTVLDATAQESSLIVGPTGCRLRVNHEIRRVRTNDKKYDRLRRRKGRRRGEKCLFLSFWLMVIVYHGIILTPHLSCHRRYNLLYDS